MTEEEFRNLVNDFYFHNIWASKDIRDELRECFAEYDQGKVLKALKATNRLFERVARAFAGKRNYEYPDTAADCARRYLAKIDG